MSSTTGLLTVRAKGVYALSYEKLDEEGLTDPSGVSRYDFPMSFAEMPRPEEGTTWQVPLIRHEGEMPPETEMRVYYFGPTEPWAIGPCTYDRMHISVLYPATPGEADLGEWIGHMYYIPELGFAVFVGISEPGNSDYFFEYTAIEAVE